MASISKLRGGYVARIYWRGERYKFWLGHVKPAWAKIAAGHLETLKASRDCGVTPPAGTREWLATIHPRIRSRLEQLGMIDPQPSSKFGRTVGTFTQDYLDSRDDWSPRRKTNMRQVRGWLVAQLGEATPLSQITPGQAAAFARWIRANFTAESHAEKTIQDAKQFLTAAVAERIISDNPFVDVKTKRTATDTRKQEVSRQTADQLIEAADHYLAALIAFARYGGLRMPSEAIHLEWAKVDWQRQTLEVYAPKTKTTRTLPIFPELSTHLTRLFEAAPAGAVYVFDQHRATAARRYRARLLALIDDTPGVEPWPDLWRNLRYTRKNELLAEYPEHVVCEWLGHDPQTGRKYYDRASQADIARAVATSVAPQASDQPIPDHPAQ